MHYEVRFCKEQDYLCWLWACNIVNFFWIFPLFNKYQYFKKCGIVQNQNFSNFLISVAKQLACFKASLKTRFNKKNLQVKKIHMFYHTKGLYNIDIQLNTLLMCQQGQWLGKKFYRELWFVSKNIYDSFIKTVPIVFKLYHITTQQATLCN